MKLLVAISHHGLGHLAQTGPVLEALAGLIPDLSVTVWSGLPAAALAARISFPVSHRREAADVGLAMRDALAVDQAVSHQAYLDFHRDWPARVAREAAWMEAEGFAAVLADVSYLPLAAAYRAGIPGIALCSLNWRDIAATYLEGLPGMDRALAEMAQAYRQARLFLRPEPAMPMAWLDNSEPLPPIAAQGQSRRAELVERLGGRGGTRRVLVGFGGISYRGRLPIVPGVTWLAPDDWDIRRDDVALFSTLGMPFLDLLASCDALLTKVGYGGFVEAAIHGIPSLYIDRPDWPETPWLGPWLMRWNRALPIVEADLETARLGTLLARLDTLPVPPRPRHDGARAAAMRMAALLGQQRG